VANTGGRDFLISYTGVNRPWAEWIAVQLEAAGYSTVLQASDSRPGSDFLHDAAGHHLREPKAIVRFLGDRD
jgi:TIR domain-containing protein